MAHDLLFQDEALQATFFGNLTAVPDPPSRIVNIFVSSTKTDLEHERRQLHDVVVPQLQRACTGVDVQIVDVQNGCEEDSLAVDHHLREIEDCHRTSLGCFFLCLIGNKYRPFTLPASIAVAEYSHIHSAAKEAGLDASLLDNHYLLDSNLLPPRYVLQARRKSSTDVTTNTEQMNKIHQDSEEGNWPEEEDKLVQIIQYGARIAIQEGLIQPEEAMQSFLLSGVHTHLRHAVKLSKHNNSGVLCVVRQFEEDWIKSQDNNEKYETIPELGQHFASKWPLEDIKEEMKEGSKSVENNKGLFVDSATENAEVEKIVKLGFSECSSDTEEQYDSLINRIVYSLVGENLMTFLDDTMTEVCNGDIARNPRLPLPQSSNLSEADTLEKRLAKEFHEIGLLELNESEPNGTNDEVLRELKILQSALIPVNEYNTLQKKKVLALAKAEMAKQEVKKKLQELDAKVMEIYRIVATARKNKTMSKKLEDQVKKTLREKKKLVEKLKKMK